MQKDFIAFVTEFWTTNVLEAFLMRSNSLCSYPIATCTPTLVGSISLYQQIVFFSPPQELFSSCLVQRDSRLVTPSFLESHCSEESGNVGVLGKLLLLEMTVYPEAETVF